MDSITLNELDEATMRLDEAVQATWHEPLSDGGDCKSAFSGPTADRSASQGSRDKRFLSDRIHQLDRPLGRPGNESQPTSRRLASDGSK